MFNSVSFIKLSIFNKTKAKDRSCFEIIAKYLNIADFTCGLYMILIVGANTYFKDTFAFNELL